MADIFDQVSEGTTKGDIFDVVAAKPSLSLGSKLSSILQPPPGYNETSTLKHLWKLPESAVEAGLTAVTGMGLGMPAGLLTYAGSRAFGKTPEQAQELQGKVSEALTYQPQNPLAQYGVQVASAPFSGASTVAGHYGGPDTQFAVDAIMTGLGLKAAMPKAPVGMRISSGELARAATAEKYKMPVPPSSIVDKPSLVMKGAEVVGDVPGLSFIKNKYNQKVNDIVAGKLEEVRNKYAPAADIEGFTQGVSDAYTQALSNVQVDRVPAKNLFGLLDKFAEQKTLSKEAKRLYEAWKLEAGEDGALSIGTLGEIKRQINAIAGKKARDSKQKILNAVLDDISEVPGGEAAKAAIKEVDKQYLWFNKSKQIQNLINGSVSYDAGKFIEPQKFIDNYAKQREGLKRYAPEAVKDLDEIANMMQVGKKSLQGYKKFANQTGTLQNLTGLGGLAASILRPEVAAGMGAGAMLTKSMMNPTGIAKNLMLRGKGKGFEGFTEPYQGWTDYADMLKAQETPSAATPPAGAAPQPGPAPIPQRPAEPTTVRTNMAGNYEQYPIYNFLQENMPEPVTRALLNQMKKGTDFEQGEISKVAHKVTEAYNQEIGAAGMAHELTKDDFIQGLRKELEYYQNHKQAPKGEAKITFTKDGFISEDTGELITSDSVAQQAAGKPYAGIEPGSPEWMEVWKARPELQSEMIDYKQKAGMAAMATAYFLLDEDDREKMLPLMAGLYGGKGAKEKVYMTVTPRKSSIRPKLGALKR